MIALMNSSKTMDFEPAAGKLKHSVPQYLKDSQLLVDELRKLAEPEFSKLLKTSEKLTKLNIERYAKWQIKAERSTSKQALLAFRGDIYSGMEVDNYKVEEFEFVQNHVRILSGLYGILRPLDLIQPYRLEMATKLATARGKNLYQFWGTKINESISKLLKREKSGVLINLCSMEYFTSIKAASLDAMVITPIFKEYRNGSYRFVTLYAKKARGMMCNYIIQNHLRDVNDLKSFNVEGYRYNNKISSDYEWAFTRGGS